MKIQKNAHPQVNVARTCRLIAKVTKSVDLVSNEIKMSKLHCDVVSVNSSLPDSLENAGSNHSNNQSDKPDDAQFLPVAINDDHSEFTPLQNVSAEELAAIKTSILAEKSNNRILLSRFV